MFSPATVQHSYFQLPKTLPVIAFKDGEGERFKLLAATISFEQNTKDLQKQVIITRN